jgi:hypothetical protein
MSKDLTVEIKGKNLVITIPMTKPTPSASGKTLSIASSHGNITTDCKLNGKPVVVGLNCYIKPDKGE